MPHVACTCVHVDTLYYTHSLSLLIVLCVVLYCVVVYAVSIALPNCNLILFSVKWLLGPSLVKLLVTLDLDFNWIKTCIYTNLYPLCVSISQWAYTLHTLFPPLVVLIVYKSTLYQMLYTTYLSLIIQFVTSLWPLTTSP